MWLRMLVAEIMLPQVSATPLLTDNEAALALTKDPHFHACTKHINTNWHYIHKCHENGDHVSYVPPKENIADIFTKALPTPAFPYLCSYLRLCNLP